MTFTYNGTSLSLGTPQDVAKVPAADGIAFTPSGNLVVGGQFTGDVYNVNPANGTYTTVSAGTPSAFMIGVSPDGQTAYVGSVGDRSQGDIGVVNLATMTVEGTIHVVGPDQNVDSIAFDNGVAYYTSSLPDRAGDFGTIDLATGVEQQLLSGVPYAHGMAFDPWTGDLILTGTACAASCGQSDQANVSQIAQISPSPTAANVVSVRTVDLGNGYYDTFDLPWVDGQGQVFAAANDGKLVFVDYAATKRVGSSDDVSQTVAMPSWLDDVVGTLVNAPQFVIWGANRSENLPVTDQTVHLRGDYNFWGSQWWDQLDINHPGGTVPYSGAGGTWPSGVAAFKGFADQSGTCGGTWSAQTGNSSNPPEAVGQYVSVIVTTNMSYDGSHSVIGGNIQEIILVKVDDLQAYVDNPGHPLTGVMVGVLCKS